MDLQAFAKRLDQEFDVNRYLERDGWNFALTPAERASLLDDAGPTFAATFNGLVLAGANGSRVVGRVYLLVFPELSLVDQVIAAERERGTPGAVIVTHHPMDMENAGRGFIAIPPRQLIEMREARIGMYVLHAPLDCHHEISTSGALAAGLGLRRVGTFAPYVAGHAGVVGEQKPEPFAVFAERVRRLCELSSLHPEQIRFAGRMVERVAIVAGGGDDVTQIDGAQALGADTYLAGVWWTPHTGEWPDANRAAIRDAMPRWTMNFLSASHDGSELVVFRDRLQPLFEEWGLDVELVRQADHWR
ncbi:MAG: Nif3-like dinuclear metal center hexameric protein [Thermomicrobiales bacterium]